MEIVKISAIWCGGCLKTNKAIKKVKENYKDITISNLDYDMDEEKVAPLNVGEILPVMIFYKDGKEVARLIGEKNYDEIVEVIKRHV